MSSIALTDFELARFFLAMVLLLASAHGVGYFCHRLLWFPKVIGEIIGGLVLGPTVFGFFFPSAYQWVFHSFPSAGQLIAVIYSIGLVLLMFMSGFEMQKTLGGEDKRLIAAILVGATAIPFLVGWFAPSFYDFTAFVGPRGNMLSLTIIIAIAIAVTSIPVISKIFFDLGIINTRFAKIVLATATLEDMILWVALAVATSVASGESLSMFSILSKVFITLIFFGSALFALPRLFEIINRSRLNLLIKSSATGYVLFICFLFAAIASILDVNIIFGGFLAGIVVGMTRNDKISSVKLHIREIGFGFFVPIYFAVVGLKLDLIRHLDPVFFLGFLLFAVLVKTLGTVMASRLAGQDWLSSVNFGAAMNARGGPGIVLATIAFDLGIISEAFFAVLVLIAIVTSLGAGYWFRFLQSRGWPLLSDST